MVIFHSFCMFTRGWFEALQLIVTENWEKGASPGEFSTQISWYRIVRRHRMTRCEWNHHHRCRATIAARLVQKWSATLGKAAKNCVRFSDLNTPYHLFIDESQLDHVFASPRHYVGEFLLESAGQAGLYRLCYCHWQALVRARLNLIGQIDISSSTSEWSILYH